MNEIKVTDLLPWSSPTNSVTSRGPAIVRTAKPDERFWDLYNGPEKQQLFDAGLRISKRTGTWEVKWFRDASAKGEAVIHQTTVVVPANMAPAPQVVIPPASDIIWSPEQADIRFWFANPSPQRYLLVRARAGTGKTFTIKGSFELAPEESMLYAVFNKKNQREAAEKITDPRVDILTHNALGFRYVNKVWSNSKPDDLVEADRLQAIQRDLPEEVATAILKLTSATKSVEINPTVSDIYEAADRFGIDCVNYEEEEAGGWTVPKLAGVVRKMLNRAMEVRDLEKRISFADQIWLPLAKNWVTPKYDLVAVDECQDMNMPQLEMMQRALRKGGRMCIVGDDCQAIYGFRGAVQGGLDMMKNKLQAKELGLTVTRRCPKAVVAEAVQYVPDYKAADDAPQGIVRDCNETQMLEQLQVGDAVLSRINAPLMPLCLALLRRGISARIEGKDIGKQLARLAREMKGKSVPHFLERVEKWATKQRARAGKSKYAEAKIELINDQAATLIAIAEGASSVHEAISRLTALFQNSDECQKPAVVFSSVHKAKGLEWSRVYVLRKTFMRKGKPMGKVVTDSKEEQNIYYVAITRAMKELVFAHEVKKQEAATIVQPASTTTGTNQ